MFFQRILQVAVLCGIIHLFVYGSTKPSAPPSDDSPTTNAPPMRACAARQDRGEGVSLKRRDAASPLSVATNEVWGFAPTEGATVVTTWRLRGAANERVSVGGDLSVPGEMTFDTFGRIRALGREFSLLGAQVGLVPEARWADLGFASRAWWQTTASNTTVVCWQNALPGRDTNTPVSVQAEFFADGRFTFRYDLASLGGAASNLVASVRRADGEGDAVALSEGLTSVSGSVPELDVLARIADGAENETDEIVSDELRATKLWDEFAFWMNPGTNTIYSRTFAIDRRGGWTSYFLSGHGEVWRDGGRDMIGAWSLDGATLAWSDDTGACGTVTASPENDTLYLPLAPNATRLTIALQVTERAERHASPEPVFLLEYAPKLEFPGGRLIDGTDGNSYCVFTDVADFAPSLDTSNRPCRAPAFEGEATAVDFPVLTEAGVYSLPAGTRAAPDNRPRLMTGPRWRTSQDNTNEGERYLVLLDPWVSYGTGHYTCEFSGSCDCVPDVGCGVIGYASVAAYIDYWDDSSCIGVVKVGGSRVWQGVAYHELWGCDHNHDEPEEPTLYCPCGCDSSCPYCTCLRPANLSRRAFRLCDSLLEDLSEEEPNETVEIVDGTNFVFGADGKLRRLTVGTNETAVVVRTIRYDDDGRIAAVDDGTNGCVTIGYDADGNIAEMCGPEGTLRAAWDENGAMTNLDTSAWNGNIPLESSRALRRTAARPRLSGASDGDGLTPLDALLHYRNGNGAPITLPFGGVNTDGLRPIDFAAVKEFVASCHEPGVYPISGTRAVPARGRLRLIVGDVTVRLTGTITYLGHCNWTFAGTMSGEDDWYDFNAANRGMLGESLTAIGRLLFEGRGTPYPIQFTGTVPLTGSGHCGD